MKKPIAVAAAVLALGAAGTAVAAPGGGVFGGGEPEKRQAEFASDLAQKLDGVNANEVEKGLEQLHAEREAEMLDERAEALASGLEGVSIEQARTALQTVRDSIGEDERPDPADLEAVLAEELGVSVGELTEARKAEMNQRLDQAVEDGVVTRERADEIRERIESGDLPPRGSHGGPGGPPHAGPDGPGGSGPYGDVPPDAPAS